MVVEAGGALLSGDELPGTDHAAGWARHPRTWATPCHRLPLELGYGRCAASHGRTARAFGPGAGRNGIGGSSPA